MNRDEKYIARKLLKLKLHEANGQRFEDLFSQIMNYAEPEFVQIKPWGNIGDRKNDGYIRSKGIYFQVHAPEDIKSSYPKVVAKLQEDFDGLRKSWSPINEFHFVINDKYLGVNADCEKALSALEADNGLASATFMTAATIENLFFDKLNDDQIESVVGRLPDPSEINTLDYSILKEVVEHILGHDLSSIRQENISLPEWDEKIAFNNLSVYSERFLDVAYLQTASLSKYLANNSNFLADELRQKVQDIYSEGKKEFSGDDLFWYVVKQLTSKSISTQQTAVFVIMARYFETCDIFEEPITEIPGES